MYYEKIENIPVIKQLYDDTITSYISLIGVVNCQQLRSLTLLTLKLAGRLVELPSFSLV